MVLHSNRIKPVMVSLFISILLPTIVTLCTKEYHLILLNVISLFSLCVLVCFCRYLINRISKPKDRRFLIGLWVFISILGFAIYCAVLFNRNMVYESDHTVYYDLQFELWNLFHRAQIKGIAGIVLSCFHSDYSYFICVPLSFLFSLSSRSHEAHILTYYLLMIVPFYFTSVLFAYFWAERFLVYYKRIAITAFSLSMVFFPLLHFASLLGMPDIFGLFFCFSILILVINQNIGKFSIAFSLLISVLSVCLVFTRRWYMFWLVGFFPPYFVTALLDARNNKQDMRETITGEAKNALLIILCVSFFLIPFIIHNAFVRQYSTEYAAFNLGGFSFELYNQVGYLGILMTILLLTGAIVGVLSEKSRMLTLTAFVGYIISVFAFTRIQNMGKHQSLVLFPYYSIMLNNFIIFSLKAKDKWKKIVLIGAMGIVFLLNCLSTMLIWCDDLEGIFLLTKYAIASRFIWK